MNPDQNTNDSKVSQVRRCRKIFFMQAAAALLLSLDQQLEEKRLSNRLRTNRHFHCHLLPAFPVQLLPVCVWRERKGNVPQSFIGTNFDHMNTVAEFLWNPVGFVLKRWSTGIRRDFCFWMS